MKLKEFLTYLYEINNNSLDLDLLIFSNKCYKDYQKTNSGPILGYCQAQAKPKLSQAGLSLALFPVFQATRPADRRRPAGRPPGQVDPDLLGS